MPRVRIILGPPGTGKTTRLIEIVKDCLDKGLQPEEIAYCSFTRKAAEEAVSRACKAFGFEHKRFKFFRTLHSMAFTVMGLNKNQVMQEQHFKELGEILGLEFSTKFNPENVEFVPFFGKLGDKCLSIYGLSRAKKIGLEEAWFQFSGRAAPPFHIVKDFVEKLTRYKYHYDLYDFTDFMDECKVTLPVKVFILDEAQDLTRQQWDFAKVLARDAEQVWIAGDDDQTIFQWAGADLRTFLAIDGQREVLPVSYRLPGKIQRFCQDISENISYRYPKTWSGRPDAEGDINYISAPGDINLRDGKEWLLLCRHSHQLKEYIKICMNQGVVFKTSDSEWSNNSQKVRAVVAWESLRKGKEIHKKDYKALDRYTTKVEKAPDKNFYCREDFPTVDFAPDWMTALELMSAVDREYIRLLRHNGESLVDAGRVQISTIHGSKGGEADNVVLMHDMSDQTYRRYLTEPDDEHRVFYVGASRAKENLHIVTPTTTRGYFRY